MSGPIGIDLSEGAAALGVLAFRGGDAARFLQGQLSAEIEGLAVGGSSFAGFHNPQGRVIALLAVTRTAADEFFAVLPRELLATVATRLGKFVLRSRLRITDESPAYRVLGVAANVTNPATASLAWGGRRLLLLPAGSDVTVQDGRARAAWECADVAAGLPQVYAATSESFVAQMLNLDLLGAIAFDKGCYTGQEVIARAHYRGRVKRRLQRWHNLSGTLLEPGQAAHAADGRSLVVVRTAADGPGSQDLLAVGNYSSDGRDTGADAAAEGSGPRVSGPLSLPYSLPE